MSRQFLRSVRVRVGAIGTLEKEFTGLRVSFKLEKSIESNPNTGTISIYNLSLDSRSKFEQNNAICSLDVGYESSMYQIFTGNITRAATKKEGSDFITEVEVGDGDKALSEAKIDVSLPPGTTNKQVIDKLTASFKDIKSGGINSVKNVVSQVISFGTGLVITGSSKDVLDNITKTSDLEWSVQDAELQIIEKDSATQETAISLSSSTGLIGSVGKIKSESGKNTPDGGIEFSCLLQANLKCGRLVDINSESVKGLYRITKISHEGDNLTGTWLSKCEAFIKK